MIFDSRISYLSEQELKLLCGKVFDLLEKRGVKMDHPEVVELLRKEGATVDRNLNIVRFPKAFMEEQIEKAPKSFSLVGKNGKNPLALPRSDGTFYTRTNTGAQSWIEPDTNTYRRIGLADVAKWARLADGLENIGFCAFPVPDDAPPPTADIYALRTMLQNTEKHIWVQPYTGESVEFLIQLAIAAAGGEDPLKANPLVSFIACSLSPLEFKHMDLDIILKCARFGIPIQPCSLPTGGATGPVTDPGIALLAAAEILAMLATAQVIQPGIPIVATPLIFSMDMSTGRSLQSSAESMRGAALAVQIIKRAFGIPVHTYGIGSDSPHIDAQSTIEGALRSMLIGMSGADILGGAGQIEVATTISPAQLVIDNEIFGIVRRILSRMTFDEENMAWEELMTVEPGGNFLSSTHTFRHCRDGLFPINFTRLAREGWEKEGKEDLVSRAAKFAKELMEKKEAPTLNEITIKEMDSIVRDADKQLC
jgi:trimethylamine--corrinoid protein Co-methyltransferase